MIPRRCRRRPGMTLIELLVVVSVIGILAAMLLPAVGTVMASAKAARCRSALQQVYLAASVYTEDNEGVVLPAWGMAQSDPSWMEVVAAGMGVGSGGLAGIPRTSVIWGCPQADRTAARLAKQSGIGIAIRLRSDLSNGWNWAEDSVVNSEWLATTYGWGPYAPCPRSAVTVPSGRMWFADCRQFNAADPLSDVGWHVYGDDQVDARHRGRSNIVFFDGHTGTLTAAGMHAAIFNPVAVP